MVEAGYSFLADVMLWLMYIVLLVAVVAVVVSSLRSFWINK
jgi:hypothetical protein